MMKSGSKSEEINSDLAAGIFLNEVCRLNPTVSPRTEHLEKQKSISVAVVMSLECSLFPSWLPESNVDETTRIKKSTCILSVGFLL